MTTSKEKILNAMLASSIENIKKDTAFIENSIKEGNDILDKSLTDSSTLGDKEDIEIAIKLLDFVIMDCLVRTEALEEYLFNTNDRTDKYYEISKNIVATCHLGKLSLKIRDQIKSKLEVLSNTVH